MSDTLMLGEGARIARLHPQSAGTKPAHSSSDMNDDVDQEPFETILTLSIGTSSADIAGQCRDAAVQFINESKNWGKAELTMWLTSSYARVIQHATKEAEENGPAVWPLPLLREIDVRLIGRIMQSAREEVLENLSLLQKDGSASFVLRGLIAGTVVRCEDGLGQPAWAPIGTNRLADRVLSLFAVDYLGRPGDYETDLFVCPECQTIYFDELARRHGVCRYHTPAQSLTAPRRRSTLPYPPMGA